MVVKIINGMRIHEPPYTKAEEDEFYRRVGRGPITVAREGDARKGKQSSKADKDRKCIVEPHSADRKSLL